MKRNPWTVLKSVSSSNFENDLNDLSRKISNKKHKNRIPYFAAAATVLLLITSGIIWMQLNRQHPIEKVSEIKINKVDKEVPEPEEKKSAKSLTEDIDEIEADEEIQPETKTKEEQQAAEKNEGKTQEKIKTITIENHIEIEEEAEVENEIVIETIPVPVQEQAAKNNIQLKIVTANKGTELAKAKPTQIRTTEDNIIHGQIISDNDGQPLPGVAVIEKGTANGTITDIDGNFQMQLKNDSNPVVASFVGMEPAEFHPEKDSDNIIALITDHASLDEVVVVGYGTQKQQSVTGSTTETLNSSAEPNCGISGYKTYLQNKAVLPVDHKIGKIVVKLRFMVSSTGRTHSFENINDADAEFFEQAKDIVLNGPGWTPAYKNNHKADSEVRLRVVFKKSKD